MSDPAETESAGRGSALFRAIMLLKLMTWVTVLVALGIGLFMLASGAERIAPVRLFAMIGVLVLLQLIAMAAWWAVRRRP